MTQKICVFGTSIGWGAWDHEMGGWVNRLRLGLEKDYHVFVYNCGVSGDTTEGMVKRLPLEAEARSARSIIIAVGVNDASRFNGEFRVSPDKFRKNLQKLIELSRQFTDTILLITPTQTDDSKLKPIPWDTQLSYDNGDIMKYVEIVKEVGDELGVSVIDNSELLSIDDLDEDGLHPNENGHEKMYRAIKDIVIDVIPMDKI